MLCICCDACSSLILKDPVVQYIMLSVVGLDIGWKSIKAIELTSDYKIVKIGSIELSNGTNHGEFEDYVKKLNELFTKHGFSKENVLINLRGSYILTRSYEPPSSGNDAFESWFVENINSLIPGAPLSDVIYDHEFIDTNRVLISFARLRVIENRLKMLKTIGIIPAAIDASCLALYRSFKDHKPLKKHKNYAIIDIEEHKTDLLLVRNKIPFISTDLMISVEDFKKGRDKCSIFCKVLYTELRKNVEYYRIKENYTIDYLIAVGDHARMRGMKKNLSASLKIPIEIGNPFKVHKIAMPSRIKPKNNSQYTQALGLALKGLDSDIGINLMPYELKIERKHWQFNKKAKKFFKKNAILSGLIFIILICMLGIAAAKHNTVKHDVAELTIIRNGLKYLNDDEKELNSKVQKLQQFGHERFFWSKTLFHIGQAVPPGVSFMEISTNSRLIPSGSKPFKQKRIEIEGVARDHTLIVRFIQNLEKHFTKISVDKIKKASKCEFKISIVI